MTNLLKKQGHGEYLSDDVLAFLHLPKTEGSTLSAILASLYGETCVTINIPSDRGSLAEILKARTIEINEVQVISGHMPFGFVEELKRPVVYFTMLRDPRERIVSDFYYIARSPQHPLFAAIKNGSLTISDHAKSKYAYNVMCSRLYPMKFNDVDLFYPKVDSESLLTAAKRTLDKCIVVGLSERFDESVALMSKFFGWEDTPQIDSKNVTENRPHFDDLSIEERNIINSQTLLDQELYCYAETCFNNQLSGVRAKSSLGNKTQAQIVHESVSN